MKFSRIPFRRTLQVHTLVVCCALSISVTRADIIELTSGGQLEGKVTKPEDDKSTFVIELAAGGKLTLPRSQVTRVDPTSDAESEYQKLALTSPDTVEGNLKMAEWCRQHKLQGDYQRHLERILQLDPNHADARSTLGFRQKDGKWMNRDDVMAARGLVMYEGRYVTPQHVELFQQQKAAKATQTDWANRIKQLRKWLTGRRQDQAAQAHTEVLAINDPQAADAVVGVLRNENDPDLKRLWMEVASHLNHRAAVDALVNLSLNDPDEDIRRQALEYLIKSGRPGLATPYVRALNNRDNEIINRAAVALGQIRDHSSIGPLIEALITTHRVKAAAANPDQHAYTFSNEGGSSYSFGGGAPPVKPQALRNRAVLDALITMSGGVSFDYDQEQWRGWLAAQAKTTAVDIRRDQ